MKGGPPQTLVVRHEADYHTAYVGRTPDGRQFFLTTPFVPLRSEFIALYVFDASGTLTAATVDDFGPRATLDEDKRGARFDELLASLGDVEDRDITVAPFEIERFGVAFGFIPQEPAEHGEAWSVIVEPGNYMCFWPPWDSGLYDT